MHAESLLMRAPMMIEAGAGNMDDRTGRACCYRILVHCPRLGA